MANLTEIARKAIQRKKGRPAQSLETALEQDTGSNGQAKAVEAGPKPMTQRNAQVVPIEDERERLLKPYQDGLPFDLDRIKVRILDCHAVMADQIVIIGKYLIWVKEEVGHGEFLGWLDTELGMSRFRAAEYMRVAQRMIESKCAHVRTFLTQAAGQSKTKLLALLDVSDEEIEEVMETETFLGKPLDEVEAMSVRELRAALKEERERNQILRDKNEEGERKLQKTKAELRKLKQPEEPDSEEALTILDRQFVKAINVVGVLERIATEFAEEYGDEGLTEAEVRDAAHAYIVTLQQKVTALRMILMPDEIAESRWHIQEGTAREEV